MSNAASLPSHYSATVSPNRKGVPKLSINCNHYWTDRARIPPSYFRIHFCSRSSCGRNSHCHPYVAETPVMNNRPHVEMYSLLLIRIRVAPHGPSLSAINVARWWRHMTMTLCDIVICNCNKICIISYDNISLQWAVTYWNVINDIVIWRAVICHCNTTSSIAAIFGRWWRHMTMTLYDIVIHSCNMIWYRKLIIWQQIVAVTYGNVINDIVIWQVVICHCHTTSSVADIVGRQWRASCGHPNANDCCYLGYLSLRPPKDRREDYVSPLFFRHPDSNLSDGPETPHQKCIKFHLCYLYCQIPLLAFYTSAVTLTAEFH